MGKGYDHLIRAAIRELKRRYPAVQTTLGVSNVSFGLSPAARIVLNSVFLHECIEAGLDSAIVHAAKIIPMARIPDEQRDVFVAHELEGRSFKELAAESGVGVNTLLARKRYAVLQLRARLQTVYDEFDR